MSLAAVSAILLQFAASLDAETVAGAEPSTAVASADSTTHLEKTFTAIVAPTLSASVPTGRGPRFRAAYEPSARWRIGEVSSTGAAPLLFQRLQLVYAPVLLPRTRVLLTSNGSIGDVDTSTQRAVLDNSQNAPLVPDLQLYSVSVGASLSHQTKHWSFDVSAPVQFQGPLGDSSDPTSVSSIRDTRTYALSTTASRRLTSRQAVSLGSNSLLAEFANSTQLGNALTLGWQYDANTRTQLSLNAGAGRLDTLETQQTTQALAPASAEYFATGGVTVSHARQFGSDSVALTLDARSDPFTQTLRPLAVLDVASTQDLTPRLLLREQVGASTSTKFEALDSDPNETGVNASVTLIWDRDPLHWRTGVRAAMRGPNLDPDREEPFEFREHLVVLFVGLNWQLLSATP